MLGKKQQKNFKKVRLLTELIETILRDIKIKHTNKYDMKEITVNGETHYIYTQEVLFRSKQKATGKYTIDDIRRNSSDEFHTFDSLVLDLVLELGIEDDSIIKLQRQLIDDI